MVTNDKLHYLNFRDNSKRLKFFSNELFLNLLKTIYFDLRGDIKIRFYIKNKTYNQQEKFLTRIRSRCILTGRSRFVFKYFRLSRQSLKFKSSFGFVSGLKKK